MSARNYWFAFGVGVLAGATVALLYAPQTGARTRKQLRKGVADAGDYLEDAGDYLREQAERLTDEAQKLAKRTRKQVESAVDEASDTVSDAVKDAVKSAKALV
jgi:gas vesicle protein